MHRLDVPIGAARQRALLALLALEANSVLPVHRLIQGLWGECPPPSAQSTLYSLISRLRAVLADDSATVVKQGSGYLLRADPLHVDIHRFLALAGEARARAERGLCDEASDLYEDAFQLWRGTPLSDVPPTPLIAAETVRLEETRLRTFEECVTVAIAARRGGFHVRRLQALVEERPFRERLWELLVEALNASGRRAEALLAYQEARAKLAQGLGLDPGRRLQELQRDILNGDDHGRSERHRHRRRLAALPRRASPAKENITGRQAQAEAIATDPRGKTGSGHRVMFCSTGGTAGAGKTTLAVHIARLSQDDFPDDELFLRLREPDADAAGPCEELARFLCALGAGEPAVSVDVNEWERLQRTLLVDRHILIILNDATDGAGVERLSTDPPTSK